MSGFWKFVMGFDELGLWKATYVRNIGPHTSGIYVVWMYMRCLK
jgi:hypothetical protein